jgi:hypothetical protein
MIHARTLISQSSSCSEWRLSGPRLLVFDAPAVVRTIFGYFAEEVRAMVPVNTFEEADVFRLGSVRYTLKQFRVRIGRDLARVP